MAEPRDPTADRILEQAWRSMRSVLDSAPQGRTLLQVATVQVEFWADSVAAARLLLQHPLSTRVELVVGAATASFLVGLALGWVTR